MTREEKHNAIEVLTDRLANSGIFYVADTSELTAEATSSLRRACFKQNVQLSVVKNTLLRKAMEKVEGKDLEDMYDVLAGPTAIMFAEVGNAPAKIIKEFRKKNKSERPILKAAFVEEAIYVGDNQLQALVDIKSKEEMIGEVIGLLQSPAKNVLSALQSGGGTIAGLVKTLSER